MAFNNYVFATPYHQSMSGVDVEPMPVCRNPECEAIEMRDRGDWFECVECGFQMSKGDD